MSRWIPLLSVNVRHQFYPQARCCPLAFDATAGTASWLREAGAQVRSIDARLDVFVPVTSLPVATANSLPTLSWGARPADPRFASVSQGLGVGPVQLHFDGTDLSRQTAHDDGGKLPPALVLSLPPALWRAGGASFDIDIAAAATIWKYWFMGAWAPEDGSPADHLQVVDLDEQVHFTGPIAESLANGQRALSVRSTAPIELRAHSERRFQLKSRDARAAALVKRLPVAGADHFARETIHGVPTLVSEIYVHR